jgi:LPS-assembly protein
MRILFIVLFALLSGPAHAFENIKQWQQVDIESDKLLYFKDKKIIQAKGDVVIKKDFDKLFADQVVIDKSSDTYYAFGHLRIEQPGGNEVFGDKAIFQRSLNNGIITNFGYRSPPFSAMASKYALMHDQMHLEAFDMVYSPCQICANNFISNSPTWQFRAKNAFLDRENERVYYHDASLEFFNIPIFYSPLLTTPAPGAKKKSGFLTPKFAFSSHNLGHSVEIPYFLSLAPNYDVTYSPKFTQYVGTIHNFEFRHLLNQGNYKLNTSITQAPKFDNLGQKIPGKQVVLGNYKLTGDFVFRPHDKMVYLSTDSQALRDELKTYNVKYGYSSKSVLRTDFNLRTFDEDYFISLRPLYFQDVRQDANRKTTPQALPYFDSAFKKDTGHFTIFSKINMVNLIRSQGISYKRVSPTLGVKKSFNINPNTKLEIGDEVRVDSYTATGTDVIVQSNYTNPYGQFSTKESRFNNNVYALFRNSQYFTTNNALIILEPKIMPIYTTDVKKLEKIPNEDSREPELSASNLFQINKFKGFDDIEDGFRVNYGLSGAINSDYIHNINFLVGQVWRSKIDDNFTSRSGMNKQFSNYVAAVDILPTSWLNWNNNLAFNEGNFKLLRTESTLNFTLKHLDMGLTYSFTDQSMIANPTQTYRQELIGSLNVKIYNGWMLQLSGNTRLGGKVYGQPHKPVTVKTALAYNSECLTVLIGVQRDFLRVKDTKPSTTPMIQIEIPSF